MTCPTPHKHRHQSKWAALKARDNWERVHGIRPGLAPYPCGDHWHIGNRRPSEGESALKRALREGRAKGRRRAA